MYLIRTKVVRGRTRIYCGAQEDYFKTCTGYAPIKDPSMWTEHEKWADTHFKVFFDCINRGADGKCNCKFINSAVGGTGNA
jgi:hypothetical protein